MTRPVFADPKTDFVFKRLFGTEEHKPLLVALLSHLLELDEDHRITSVELLAPEQRPPVSELKHSIVAEAPPLTDPRDVRTLARPWPSPTTHPPPMDPRPPTQGRRLPRPSPP